MGPVAVRSASRLRIAAWDERGYWLTDFDSPRAELYATPLVVELAPSVHRRVRVLQAGATMLRVEILEPEPGWRRTATLASHGNPLGLAAGDVALAVGNEVTSRGKLRAFCSSSRSRSRVHGGRRKSLFATGRIAPAQVIAR